MDEDHVCEEGAPPWMATFADLSTLLLTFFVLLLSFANMDVVKFREMMGSMQDAFGYQRVNFGNWNPEQVSDQPSQNTVNTDTGSGGVQADVRTLIEIQSIIESQNEEDKVEAEASPRGVVVRVKDSVMFKPGSDQIKLQAHPMLNRIVKVLGRFPCEIMVEGHTDDTPIRTKRFPSNWELSSKRAIAVMRYLAEIGGFSPEKLGAAGYADTRPLVENTSTANRATNRRVEFICVRDDEGRKRAARVANEMAAKAKAERAAAADGDKDGGGLKKQPPAKKRKRHKKKRK